MTPSRWQQVEELYHATLECEPSQRAAFLAQADPREVESLLAQQSGATPLVRPAWEGAASLFGSTVATMTPGSRQSPTLGVLALFGLWDSAADGRRFLDVPTTSGQQTYTVVLNW
jgi:hypothetical protein